MTASRQRQTSAFSHLVNVTESDALDRLVFEDLTDDTAISASDDKNIFGVGVRRKGQMSNHLLVPDIN